MNYLTRILLFAMIGLGAIILCFLIAGTTGLSDDIASITKLPLDQANFFAELVALSIEALLFTALFVVILPFVLRRRELSTENKKWGPLREKAKLRLAANIDAIAGGALTPSGPRIRNENNRNFLLEEGIRKYIENSERLESEIYKIIEQFSPAIDSAMAQELANCLDDVEGILESMRRCHRIMNRMFETHMSVHRSSTNSSLIFESSDGQGFLVSTTEADSIYYNAPDKSLLEKGVTSYRIEETSVVDALINSLCEALEAHVKILKYREHLLGKSSHYQKTISIELKNAKDRSTEIFLIFGSLSFNEIRTFLD